MGKQKIATGPLGLQMWIWSLIGVSVIIFTGKIVDQLYSGKNGRASSNKSPTGGSKTPKTTADLLDASSVPVPTKPYTAQDLIDLSYEMYAIAHKSETLDYDNAATVKGMLLVIDKLDAKIRADPDPDNHKAIKTEMQNGLKVIRGTIMKKLDEDSLLSEEQISSVKGFSKSEAFTFDDPIYWEQHFNATNPREWYVGTKEEIQPFWFNESRQWPNVVLNTDGIEVSGNNTEFLTFVNDSIWQYEKAREVALAQLKNATSSDEQAKDKEESAGGNETSVESSNATQQKSQSTKPFVGNAQQIRSLLDMFGEKGMNFPRDARILMLGCGTSNFSHYLVEDLQYENIVNIDVSESAVRKMQSLYPNEDYRVMEAQNLTFPDQEFDVIIEKGVLDAIEMNRELVEGVQKEIRRVSKSKGNFVSISVRHATPEADQQFWGENCVEHILLKLDALGALGSQFTLLHKCTW